MQVSVRVRVKDLLSGKVRVRVRVWIMAFQELTFFCGLQVSVRLELGLWLGLWLFWNDTLPVE
jgi:hypothetical protein